MTRRCVRSRAGRLFAAVPETTGVHLRLGSEFSRLAAHGARESVTEPSSQKSLLMLADPDLERLVAPDNGDPVEESDYRNMIVTRAGELMRTEFNEQA